MADFATLRRMMVDGQIRTADVTDRPLIEAMLQVPRERFVPERAAALAYLDMDVPAMAARAGQPPRRLLKPMVLARMLQALDIEAGHRVLDVGCATGYAAALLAQLGAALVALEEDDTLVRHARHNLAGLGLAGVDVVQGRLREGYAAAAPFDAILVEGCIEVEPEALCRQLADGGRLICIQATGPVARTTLYRRDLDDITARTVFDASGPHLPGFARPEAFVF